MPRLPIPGSDDGTWGDILNDFLTQEHNADGTQKAIPQSKVTNLVSDLAGKQATIPAGTYVDTTTAQNVAGKKTLADDSIFASGRPWVDIEAKGAVVGAADNGPAINSAISTMAALGGGDVRIFKSYNFSTPIVGASGVRLLGTTFPTGGAGLPARLIYTGSGSTTAIQAAGVNGFQLENLAVLYSSNTFTGVVLDMSRVAVGCGGKNVYIGAAGQATKTASACLQLDQATTAKFERWSFQDADHCITGKASTTVAAGSNGAVLPQATINVVSTARFSSSGTFVIGNSTIAYTGTTATSFTGCTGGSGTLATGNLVVTYANNIQFDTCHFINANISHVHNSGQGWSFINSTVEYIVGGAAGFYTHDPGNRAQGFSVLGGWWGDVTNGGTQIVWSGDGLTIGGGLFLGIGNNATAIQIDENSCNGFDVSPGCLIYGLGTCKGIDFGVTSGHADVRIAPGWFQVSTKIAGNVPLGGIVDVGTGPQLYGASFLIGGPPNLMTADQASFEGGIADWVPFDVTKNTVARSTAWSADGVASLLSTTTVAGPQDVRVNTAVKGVPVLPNTTYTVVATMHSANARTVDLILTTCDASGSQVGSVQVVGNPTFSTTTAVKTATITTNAIAAYLQVQPRWYATTSADTGNAVDKLGVFLGSSVPTWVLPGSSTSINGADITTRSLHGPATLPLLINPIGSGTGGTVFGDGAGNVQATILNGIQVQTGSRLFSGAGAPNVPGSVAGDFYLRTDTPSTSLQRIYVATAANTWTGIL
ncbi:MAG TPA: hypothetical protein VM077_01960 [Candidatus Limnocylindrales bacterium]|nr:hypothetical protein [Candidatus Limnocylindrales bacterium]